MKYRWCEVNYEGFTFRVEGDWERAIKQDMSEPGQPAGFYEYDIYLVRTSKGSMNDLLVDKLKSNLVEQAEEILREMV